MTRRLLDVSTISSDPFYAQPLRPWGGRPERAMFNVNEEGCFIWQGCVNSKGYPCRGSMLVHRLAWISFFGPIPGGCQIHHICKDKRCINISHLECLTVADHREVEGRPLKLDEQKVRTILMLCDQGVPRRVIAAEFDIARHYVTDIRNGKAWKHVVREYRREQTYLSPNVGDELLRAA
jgi:hypothetical protein